MAFNKSNNISLELNNESNDTSDVKYQLIQLTKENDCYKQNIHTLQSKIQIDSRIQDELHETIDNLEKSMQQLKCEFDKKVSDIEERNGLVRDELLSRLNEVERESEEKTNEIHILKEKLMEKDKLLSLANDGIQLRNLSVHDESMSNDSQKLNELMEQLLQEESARKSLEQTVHLMSKEECELKEILYITNTELSEKKRILEMTRDELNQCRIELETMKNNPNREMCKGNSLFAEVEDRRKKLLDRMTDMKQCYNNAKRCINNKDNEIKALKLELAALLKKQKDDADDCIQENGDLLEKYKDRILELEDKLSDQQKKYRKLEIQKQPIDNTFSYIQKLLDEKKKEIDELEMKLENSSKQSLIQEEMQNKINRQMRYWRNKAMSCEAHIDTIKSRLNNNSSIKNEEIFKTFENDCAMINLPIEESFMDLSEKPPPIIDETIITLDELIKIPKVSMKNICYDDKKVDGSSVVTSNDNISIDYLDMNKKLNDTTKFDNNKIIKSEQLNEYNCNKENKFGILLNNPTNSDQNNENKGKKCLRFAEGTAANEQGSQSEKLCRKNTPSYKILHISSKSSDK